MNMPNRKNPSTTRKPADISIVFDFKDREKALQFFQIIVNKVDDIFKDSEKLIDNSMLHAPTLLTHFVNKVDIKTASQTWFSSL
jgi:hypothetical protein